MNSLHSNCYSAKNNQPTAWVHKKKHCNSKANCNTNYSRTLVARTLMARSFTTAVSNSFLGPLEKSPIAADVESFGVIFFLMLKMVYCVYSLELPQ